MNLPPTHPAVWDEFSDAIRFYASEAGSGIALDFEACVCRFLTVTDKHQKAEIGRSGYRLHPTRGGTMVSKGHPLSRLRLASNLFPDGRRTPPDDFGFAGIITNYRLSDPELRWSSHTPVECVLG